MANKLVFFMASFLILTSFIFLMTSQGSSGAGPRANNEACAACRYSRRRCTPECLFRPYILTQGVKEFRSVIRLYPLAYVEKLLLALSPEDRADAMKTIIFESNMRSTFPVSGCCQYIHDLQNQIALADAELLLTRAQLHRFTSAIAASDPTIGSSIFNPATTADSSRSTIFSDGGEFGNFPYGNCVPVTTMPLETVQQFLPNSNNIGSTMTTREFFPTSVVELYPSELRIFSRNLTVNNNNAFSRVPTNDPRIDLGSSGWYCGNLGYRECVTETTSPLETSSNARQILPDWYNLCSESNIANNNNEYAFEFDEAALQAYANEQIGDRPCNRDNQIPPTNDNSLQPDDHDHDDHLSPKPATNVNSAEPIKKDSVFYSFL